ncbi:MAG: DNA-3-methyladenine glycosylase family protein [Anaerovoracaceae bacterium]|jgi:DNA-3-methyladenine glycosylase II
MEIFQYGDTEIEYLKKKDKRLGQAIERIGKIERQVIQDLFTALIDSIVSQQISGKAAETVFNRLCNLVGEISPAAIARVSVEEIQQCGMSLRKASYIKGIADAVFSGEFNLEELKSLPDDQVIKRLTTLRGVGAWTAEMLMIFSMERPDVVSWDDLGIRRGMCKLYNHKVLTKEQFMRYKKRYSPFGSVASLYLWEISAE